ncbi:MAG: hypothetical protein IJZ55_06070 [Lachnospiraceae bacterium]|nr:hypothetical protein [Lachnospiraceae bacterium]
MAEKKVIAFIVEGASDEAALGTIMKEYFLDNEVQFVVIRGDITTKDYVSKDAILKKINEQIEEVKKRYRYQTEHFIKIIHLTDADGVYVGEDCVKYAEVEGIQYYTDHMETAKVKETVERNVRKADILFKLRRTGTVQGIPYKIYYNSCNLEHVLYNELKDFTDEEKRDMSDDFAEKYEGKAEEFVAFISDTEIAVPGTYQKTWDFLEKDKNSLNRHSNMHLIFEK